MIRRLSKLLALPLLLALLALACEKSSEVVDVIPPAPPDAALVSVSSLGGGQLRVTGGAGAVEGGATVLAENATDGVSSASAGAAGDGGFSLQIAGALLDEIRLRARDAAGNTSSSFSTVVAGAPFALSAVSGDGQSGVVGSALPAALVFELRDGGDSPVPGIVIDFVLAAGEGGFDPASATTGADGRVSSTLTLGETAGTLEIQPAGATLSIDSVEGMTATALPGAAAELAWVEGDGQKDGPGQTLFVDLVVKVRDEFGNGVAGEAVALSAGQDGSVTPGDGVSDAQGRVTCTWTLGPANGAQTLTASHATLADALAGAVADDPPSLLSVNPTSAVDPGDILSLSGTHFCATAAFNTVLFGDTPGEPTGASETTLSVRVPQLAAGIHTLSLAVGHQAAPETYPIEVVEPLGDVLDHPFVGGEVDVEFLVPSASTRYALIPYNLELDGPLVTSDYGIASEAFIAEPLQGREADFALDFHRRVLAGRGDAPFVGERLLRERTPVLGDRETFNCLSNAYGSTVDPANYSQVSASLKYSGDHTLIYVDINTPAADLPQARIDELGDRFDDVDYGLDVAAFGDPSDVDANGRAVILLSPVVNALTPQGSSGYIGGFFNPIDLDVWAVPAGTSNHGEFFYAIVPDPDGEYSIVHTIDDTIAALKSIFAHEFQHMINSGHRFVASGDPFAADEELWMNEGLSHLAENLCGYQLQNTARVKLYLHTGVHTITTLTLLGNDLAERGASYLFCRYLEDRWPGIARDLADGPESGPANVSQAAGLSFEQIYKDWIAAIYLDDRDLDGDGFAEDLGPAFRFTSHNLRTDFPYDSGQQDALSIATISFDDPAYVGGIANTCMDYLHLEAGAGWGNAQTLRFTGAGSAMGLLTVRVGH